MRKESLLLAFLLGISTPTIATTVGFEQPAIAQASLPTGQWLDRNHNFSVDVSYYNNALHYEGYDLNNEASIHLSGATVGGTSQRRTYTWRNGGHRYRIAWRPSDPNVARLQVFAPNGRELVNTLMDNVLSP